MQKNAVTPKTITWAQLHDCSNGHLFSSPQGMVNDGADLLALLQELGGNYDSASCFKHIDPLAFFNGLRIAEGLIRTGSGLMKVMEAKHDD